MTFHIESDRNISQVWLAVKKSDCDFIVGLLMRFAGIGVESAGRSKDNEGPVVCFTSNET